MIRENQELWNKLNILSDGVIVFCSFLLGYVIRFYVLPGGRRSLAFRSYILAALVLAGLNFLASTILGMYESRRRKQIYQEFGSIILINMMNLILFMMGLFVIKSVHFARLALGFFYLIETMLLCLKRYVVHKTLNYIRAKGFNQKDVILIGSDKVARMCLWEIRRTPKLGYRVVGYISHHSDWQEVRYLGDYSMLEEVLARMKPEEAIAGLGADEQDEIPGIIDACERNGIKLSLIPFYAWYLPAHPQFDSLGGIPMLNIRRIPLDNIGNAFLKRSMDILCSALMLVLSLPLMLAVAAGVFLSSPGPVIFRQERMGLHQKTFLLYKFRSMHVDIKEDAGWSRSMDSQMTGFGAFIRRYSLDELPQFFNVLKGEMSLVGPRPEIPRYVERFKQEIPLYMVKHQVKPGITGWAQVHGLRGDTSIEERISHDIYYIENWSLWLDIKILFMTAARLRNNEKR